MAIQRRCIGTSLASILIVLASTTAFAGHVFFSTSNTLNGTVTVGNPTINFPSASGTGTLYFWVTDSTPVTPPPGPLSFAAFAVQVNRNGTSANITSAQVLNFNFHSTLAASGTDLGPTAQNRWDAVTVNPIGPDFNAAVVQAMVQTGPGTAGFNPLNDGLHLNPGSATNGTLDTGYDRLGHAFLHGQLTFSVVGTGTSTINLSESPLGIIGGGMDLTNQFTYGFATINVVPEPSTLLLAGSGLIGLVAAARRRVRPS